MKIPVILPALCSPLRVFSRAHRCGFPSQFFTMKHLFPQNLTKKNNPPTKTIPKNIQKRKFLVASKWFHLSGLPQGLLLKINGFRVHTRRLKPTVAGSDFLEVLELEPEVTGGGAGLDPKRQGWNQEGGVRKGITKNRLQKLVSIQAEKTKRLQK